MGQEETSKSYADDGNYRRYLVDVGWEKINALLLRRKRVIRRLTSLQNHPRSNDKNRKKERMRAGQTVWQRNSMLTRRKRCKSLLGGV